MRIRVLGCSGSSAPGRAPSCYLLDRGVAVDAGSLASGLPLDEQDALRDVFLTHAHWDHCRDLPIAVANRSPDAPTLTLRALPETIAALRAHLFNDEIWFRAFDLPSMDTPYVAATPIRSGETVLCGGYRITAFAVPHSIPAVSYVVDDGSSSVVINSDTGGGGIFRTMPRAGSPLRAVFLEASFPDRMSDFAELTGHLTPSTLERECADLPADVAVFVTHIKPAFEDEILSEIAALRRQGVRACRDGDVFEF